jgi:hypothetical protein
MLCIASTLSRKGRGKKAAPLRANRIVQHVFAEIALLLVGARSEPNALPFVQAASGVQDEANATGPKTHFDRKRDLWTHRSNSGAGRLPIAK